MRTHLVRTGTIMALLALSLPTWSARCGQCGTDAPDDAKFCPECGVKKTVIPLYNGMPGTTAGQECINPKDGAVMVWVPAGEFLMGSSDADEKAESDEKPQHRVYLDGYWIYKYEVTVAQYYAYCIAMRQLMPKDEPPVGWQETHPMICVSWEEACAYAKWAMAQLPSEAQWEKAARGTDGRIYPWGNLWNADKCNNSYRELTYYLRWTLPVGSFEAGASPYGCQDMAGNVWEWCMDWYDPEYYANAPQRNPTGPDECLINNGRVMRGGCYDNLKSLYRSACRGEANPTDRSDAWGFRCVVSPPAP